ncbi:MAG: radical SAM protein [Methanosarcinaceae archaeon]|nr:radical SAM protein [Methanosarcinaceae archaeon]MDD4330845.1 radical SAM protein [Methanosarcinaceae archaeon]MDD4748934.1 radical SAM protein [Methanosarcinaceae archaeon]
MQSRSITAEIKAQLISIGSVSVDPALVPGSFGSTAGPGAGTSSVFFRAGSQRVRLNINKASPLSIEKVGEDGTLAILKDGVQLVCGRLERALAHCPEQAFVTLCESCIFNCSYCPVPKLQGGIKTDKEVLDIVDAVAKAGKLKAISLTSGVEESVEAEVQRVLKLLPELRKYEVPIGVSVYPTEGCSKKFFEAGATEVKYNVETMEPDIFKKVCKDLDRTYILDKLEEAVEIFGKNKVHSNFIIGLGESDACVKAGVEALAKRGIIPILRPISPHPLRVGSCFMERPTPKRLLKLAKMEKEILEKYGLRPDFAKSMCLSCGGCDLVPFVDF